MDFPESASEYDGLAQTVLHGLRAGDDLDRFTARVRANEQAIADPAFLDTDTLQRLHTRIQRWLALPCRCGATARRSPRWKRCRFIATSASTTRRAAGRATTTTAHGRRSATSASASTARS
jgi:hypothetical protein